MTESGETERQRLKRIRSSLEKRAAICRIIRSYFYNRGFLEVDTPVRSSAIAPELYIDPFRSEGCFLSTSPELYMKRLIASGYEKIFQISHCFRKDERGRHHNPEFALLEWYRVNCDYRQMLSDTEEMVCTIAETLDTPNRISYRNTTIDVSMPWPRITVKDAFLQYAGWDPTVCKDLSAFDVDLVTKVMPNFPSDRPIILSDYPASMASLARISTANPLVAERAEVFIGGMEIANAYSELADARQQRRRFEYEIEQIQKERNITYAMPEAFIDALHYFPPSGGIALGVDRLVMLFCDADTIDDVIAFPDA